MSLWCLNQKIVWVRSTTFWSTPHTTAGKYCCDLGGLMISTRFITVITKTLRDESSLIVDLCPDGWQGTSISCHLWCSLSCTALVCIFRYLSTFFICCQALTNLHHTHTRTTHLQVTAYDSQSLKIHSLSVLVFEYVSGALARLCVSSCYRSD